MSQVSNIEWTDATWNPVRGCVKVSPGCANCYAETFAERWRGLPGHPYEQGFDLRLVPDKLTEPLSWKKPRRIFVNSMSDLFQAGVPDSFIDQVFAVMSLASKHTFQVLTKRPTRMLAYLTKSGRRSNVEWARTDIQQQIEATWSKSELLACYAKTSEEWDAVYRAWPLPNVWLGVSVENQHFVDERIPLLLQTPAAVRFISAEPLLGPISLRWLAAWNGHATKPRSETEWVNTNEFDGLRRLDWVIVGGESGPGARPFRVQWARSILQQCKAAGVPVFIKQFGANPEWPQGCGDCDPCIAGEQCYQQYNVRMELRDRKGGDLSEWPADLRVRDFPATGRD